MEAWKVVGQAWYVYSVAREVLSGEDMSKDGILRPVWDGMNWIQKGKNNVNFF